MSADFVVLGLGSNLNHPIKNLRQALAEIKKLPDCEVLNVSSIYESDAQVPDKAPAEWNQKFLNAAVLIRVNKTTPLQLLNAVKNIEKKLGRPTSEVWAPRLIDIDILYWHKLVLGEKELSLPHARLSERPFALLPLFDVFPEAEVARPMWSYAWVSERPFSTKKSATEFWPRLIGIINLTDDSFSDGGQYVNESALRTQIEKLIGEGAEILDFGAESTRPGAKSIDEKYEFERIQFGIKTLNSMKLNHPVQVSIDSYKSSVIEKCLESFEFDFINDVSGLINKKMIDLAKQSQKKVFVMHSLSVPAKSDEFISEQMNPMAYLKAWWAEKRQSCLGAGLLEENLIFDPGIGFGKTKSQSLYILNNLTQFGQDDLIASDILIGHSRKSYQTLFSDRAAQGRDLETALTTAKLNLAFTQYLRIHDIKSQTIALRSM